MPDPGNSGQKSSPCPWCFEQVPWDVFTGPRNTTLNPQSSWGWARKMPFQRGPLSWWATGIYSWRQQLSISSFTKTEQGADREWDWTTTTGQNKMIAYSEEHIQPPSFYCSNLYLFKASIHLGHIAVCRKWCLLKCAPVCVHHCEWVKNPFHPASATNLGVIVSLFLFSCRWHFLFIQQVYIGEKCLGLCWESLILLNKSIHKH